MLSKLQLGLKLNKFMNVRGLGDNERRPLLSNYR